MIFKGYSHFPNIIAPTGATGPAGEAATIQIGTVTTGEPGSQAEVTNSGTEQNAVLDFTIPQGATGATGPAGPEGPEGPAGPTGATGATGPAGEAATIQIGTVTTGEPGSQAEVTNSGTEQNAVLDFTIPQGEPGTTGTPQFLTAYSVPPQSATSGSPLVFDQNAASSGTAVTHTANSSEINLQQTGYYNVAFFGTLAAASSNTFPVSELLYLELDGSPVTGAGARQGFQSDAETDNMAFTQIIPVSSAPATLQVVGQGGNVLYSDTSITVTWVGDL